MTKFDLVVCITVSLVLAGILLFALYQRFQENAIAQAEAAAKLKGRLGFSGQSGNA